MTTSHDADARRQMVEHAKTIIDAKLDAWAAENNATREEAIEHFRKEIAQEVAKKAQGMRGQFAGRKKGVSKGRGSVVGGTNLSRPTMNVPADAERRVTKRHDTLCTDCGFDTTPCSDKRGCRHAGKWEHYMVHNALWKKAGMSEGYLCIGCLEKRLGRTLCRADFTAAPINDPHNPWNTPRLKDRLARS